MKLNSENFKIFLIIIVAYISSNYLNIFYSAIFDYEQLKTDPSKIDSTYKGRIEQENIGIMPVENLMSYASY